MNKTGKIKYTVPLILEICQFIEDLEITIKDEDDEDVIHTFSTEEDPKDEDPLEKRRFFVDDNHSGYTILEIFVSRPYNSATAHVDCVLDCGIYGRENEALAMDLLGRIERKFPILDEIDVVLESIHETESSDRS